MNSPPRPIKEDLPEDENLNPVEAVVTDPLRGVRASSGVNKAKSTEVEFSRLKNLVPSISRKQSVSQLDVILEAIRYIDSLQDQLIEQIQDRRLPVQAAEFLVGKENTIKVDQQFKSKKEDKWWATTLKIEPVVSFKKVYKLFSLIIILVVSSFWDLKKFVEDETRTAVISHFIFFATLFRWPLPTNPWFRLRKDLKNHFFLDDVVMILVFFLSVAKHDNLFF